MLLRYSNYPCSSIFLPISGSTASLRFQPTKRPQVSALKPKSKPALQQTSQASSLTGDSLAPERPGVPGPANHLVRGKNTLANWTTDAEDRETAEAYPAEKRQRGGRKNRKKNRDGSSVPQNWEDIYDPSRPNNYEEYKNSHERNSGVSDWKVRLYEHRARRRRNAGAELVGLASQPSKIGLSLFPSDLLNLGRYTNCCRDIFRYSTE